MNIEQIREKFKGAYVAKYEKAQKRSDGKYLSDRNDEDIPLVCQELNVLTVEDYNKWYGLYYLMEDPDTEEIMLVTLAWGDILEGIDNDFYPDSVIKFCMKNNIMIDSASYLCICKMLIDDNMEDILNDHLPELNFVLSIIISYNNSISRTFHVSVHDNPLGYSIK